MHKDGQLLQSVIGDDMAKPSSSKTCRHTHRQSDLAADVLRHNVAAVMHEHAEVYLRVMAH